MHVVGKGHRNADPRDIQWDISELLRNFLEWNFLECVFKEAFKANPKVFWPKFFVEKSVLSKVELNVVY